MSSLKTVLPGASRAQRAAIVVACVLFMCLLTKLIVGQAYHGAMAESPIRGMDQQVYFRAAQRLAAGKPLYVLDAASPESGYIYLPWMAILVSPLRTLSASVDHQAWVFVMLASVMAAAIVAARAVSRSAVGWAFCFCLFLLTGLRFWPSVMELAVGNVDFILLFLVCLMSWAAAHSRWLAVGVLIAIATMIKTWAIGYVAILILAWQFRAAMMTLGMAVVLALVSFAIVGFDQLPAFFESTRLNFQHPHLAELSAQAVSRMFFEPNAHITPFAESHVLRAGFVGISFLAAGTLLGSVFAGKFHQKGPVARMLLAPFCSCLLLTGLPVCHYIYFVLVLPAVWLLVVLPVVHRVAPPAQWWMQSVAIISYLVLATPMPTMTPVPDAIKDGIGRLWLIVPMVIAFALSFAICIFLRSTKAAAAAASHPAPGTPASVYSGVTT